MTIASKLIREAYMKTVVHGYTSITGDGILDPHDIYFYNLIIRNKLDPDTTYNN